MKAKTLLIFAMLILACLIGWTVHAQRSKAATTWEYQVVFDPAIESLSRTASFDKGVKQLNELGAQGWEMIGINNTQHGVMLYLKRAR
ncbi:MAG TPA: hypothetical protein VF766_08760 [Pyrinomonadaceae bacterium]